MSIYYMVDAHTNPIGDSQINDVLESSLDSQGRSFVVSTGNFPIRIPETVKLPSDPTDLNDLITLKYQGILDNYPGFTNIIFDAMLDDTGFTLNGGLHTKQGNRLTAGWNNGSSFSSDIVDVSPITVEQCVVNIEYFRWRYRNPKDGRCERIYEEVDSGNLPNLQVTSDNGSNFTSVGQTTGGDVVNITGGTGSLVGITMGGVSFNPDNLPTGITFGEHIHVASWSVVF